MSKVLVTGATGFIGRYVIRELLNRRFEVIATSTSAQTAAMQDWFPFVTYKALDFNTISENENYFDFFFRPDLVLHLAWEGLPNYNAVFHFEENLSRHYRLLKNMIENGLKDLTVSGTCLEYGFKQGQLREEMLPDPVNAYAIAKDTLRKFLAQLQNTHSFCFKWVRLFYMYGQGQNPKSLFSQLEEAVLEGKKTFPMSGGEQQRDYLPVETVAHYLSSIAVQQAVTGVINCSSGKPVYLKELVMQYLQKKGANIELNLSYYPYLDYEPMSFWGDNTKLQTILANEKSH